MNEHSGTKTQKEEVMPAGLVELTLTSRQRAEELKRQLSRLFNMGGSVSPEERVKNAKIVIGWGRNMLAALSGILGDLEGVIEETEVRAREFARTNNLSFEKC